MSDPVTPKAVVAFWLEAGPRAWFRRSPKFDDAIRARFASSCATAASRGLDDWRGEATGALALLLLLDQFPRHVHRGSAEAYAADPRAREVANGALRNGFDLSSLSTLQPFFYLPFSHHEDAFSQERAIGLFEMYAQRKGRADDLRSARRHAGIIARFGRFPHRNVALGRLSTSLELDFLAAGGFHG